VQIYLAKFGDGHLDAPAAAFETLARSGERHELVESAAEADVVLFTQCHLLPEDWRLRTIRAHPDARRFLDKVMVYDERDRPWCAFPGVYVSMPARYFHPAAQRAWGYYRVPEVAEVEPDLLFSFIGSPSARCREPLYHLRHADAVVERVDGFTFYDASSTAFEARRARFREVLSRSRFVLCPRGRGTSSIRLYETLAAGRVPVVIADQWVEPLGLDWQAFSVRWPEGDVKGLVDHLTNLDRDWETMAASGRAAYERHFAPAVAWDRICDSLADIRTDEPAASRASGRRNRGWAAAGFDASRWRLRASAVRAVRRFTRRGP
jgi:hypothetical protein